MFGFPQDPGQGASGTWGCFVIGALIAMVLFAILFFFANIEGLQFLQGLRDQNFDTKGTNASQPSGGGGSVPEISERTYVGGNSPVRTSRAFSLSSSLALDVGAARSDGERTVLRYGESEETGQIIIAISSVQDEGYGLNVFSGPWVATTMGTCDWQVDVTASTVSGHVSCANVPAENQQTGMTGQIDIELDFSANS